MKKTQIGWVTIGILVLVVGFSVSTIPVAEIRLLLAVATLIALLLFYKLTVTVDDQFVRFSFGIGLIKNKYLLEDIAESGAVEYFPLGWGIRFRLNTTVYSVSGRKAIELSFKNKKRKVWIGTDSPDELSEFINRKLTR